MTESGTEISGAKLSPWKPCHFPRSKEQTRRCGILIFCCTNPYRSLAVLFHGVCYRAQASVRKKCAAQAEIETSSALIPEILPEKAVVGDRSIAVTVAFLYQTITYVLYSAVSNIPGSCGFIICSVFDPPGKQQPQGRLLTLFLDPYLNHLGCRHHPCHS